MKKIVITGLLQAITALAYITFIAALLSNAPILFGKTGDSLSLIAFLLTFVISAALMALIVFGAPVIWYLDGSKKEAIHLVLATIAFLVVGALIAFAILVARISA